MKNHKTSKFTKVITVFSVIVFILAFLILLSSIYLQKNPDKLIFGYRVYQIATGSMEPDIKVGDVVLVKKVDPSLLSVGDTISFVSTDPQIYGQINTHSIYEIDREDDEYVFITKGILNPEPDEYPVHQNNVIGKVVGVCGSLGKVYGILSNRVLSFCLTIVPLFIIFLIYFVEFVVVINKPSDETEEDGINKK